MKTFRTKTNFSSKKGQLLAQKAEFSNKKQNVGAGNQNLRIKIKLFAKSKKVKK